MDEGGQKPDLPLRAEDEATARSGDSSSVPPAAAAPEGGSRPAGGTRQDLFIEGGRELTPEELEKSVLAIAADEMPPDLDAPVSRPLDYGPKNINWWYPRLADWLLENPDKYLRDAAPVFDVSASWLYSLWHSDTFQDYWHQRSGQVVQVVEKKAKVLADRLLDSFAEDLDRADRLGKPLPIDTRLEVLDVTMKRFGYGQYAAKPPGTANPQNIVPVTINNLGPVSDSELARARSRLKASEQRQLELRVKEEESQS